MSFKTMLSGGREMEEIEQSDSSLNSSSSVDFVENDLPQVDSLFRAQYESSSNLLVDDDWKGEYEEISDMYFISPVNSENTIMTKNVDLSRKYNVKQEHYGVDIVAREDSPIKCVADGTVIVSDWTEDNGYVVGIQHKNNIITFYKHNSVVLKKVGEFVRSGDIIAIIGGTGRLSMGTHLHFELWYKGSPINPEYFITF
jgi:murein DD-endopeptidase MepM/ murein hydrolase activator NlpD